METEKISQNNSRSVYRQKGYRSDYKYYAFGVICGGTENTKLYKIYPNIVKTSTFKEPEVNSTFEISGNTKLNVTSGETSVRTGVKATDGLVWKVFVSTEDNWLNVSITGGTGSNDSIVVNIGENGTSSKRTGTVIFYVDDGSNTIPENDEAKISLTIEQDKGNIQSAPPSGDTPIK
jgi:hypothetical protein